MRTLLLLLLAGTWELEVLTKRENLGMRLPDPWPGKTKSSVFWTTSGSCRPRFNQPCRWRPENVRHPPGLPTQDSGKNARRANPLRRKPFQQFCRLCPRLGSRPPQRRSNASSSATRRSSSAARWTATAATWNGSAPSIASCLRVSRMVFSAVVITTPSNLMTKVY